MLPSINIPPGRSSEKERNITAQEIDRFLENVSTTILGRYYVIKARVNGEIAEGLGIDEHAARESLRRQIWHSKRSGNGKC